MCPVQPPHTKDFSSYFSPVTMMVVRAATTPALRRPCGLLVLLRAHDTQAVSEWPQGSEKRGADTPTGTPTCPKRHSVALLGVARDTCRLCQAVCTCGSRQDPGQSDGKAVPQTNLQFTGPPLSLLPAPRLGTEGGSQPRSGPPLSSASSVHNFL